MYKPQCQSNLLLVESGDLAKLWLMLLFGLKSTLLGSGVIMNLVLCLLFLFLDMCFKLFMFLTRHLHCVLSFIRRIHNVFEVEINIGLLGDLTVGDCIDEFMGEPTGEFR